MACRLVEMSPTRIPIYSTTDQSLTSDLSTSILTATLPCGDRPPRLPIIEYGTWAAREFAERLEEKRLPQQ